MRSLIQEQYEAAYQQRCWLRGSLPAGHYCVFLAGKYVSEVDQEECCCRPSRYVHGGQYKGWAE